MDREEEIRLIAYRIWEEDDYCHGHDQEHWLKAELIWQERQNSQVSQMETEKNCKSTSKSGKTGKVSKAGRKKS